MTPHLVRIAVGLLLLGGCAEDNEKSVTAGPGESSRLKQVGLATAPEVGAAAQTPPAGPAEPAEPVARKIIYNAEVAIVADDFTKAERALEALIREYGGYLAQADVSGSPGSQRRGTWRVRVPIARYESFLEAVIRLGELERRQVSTQDVTAEYYDLDARIKNKKVEEGRLLKHLEQSTGKLEEILKVEQELARVREEVERQEGRLRLLANLTELTTVTITIQERRGYKPPEAAGFGTRIARAFVGSVASLRDFGENLVVVAVAVLPWLAVIVVLALAVLWALGRLRSAGRARNTPGAAAG